LTVTTITNVVDTNLFFSCLVCLEEIAHGAPIYKKCFVSLLSFDSHCQKNKCENLENNNSKSVVDVEQNVLESIENGNDQSVSIGHQIDTLPVRCNPNILAGTKWY
jgi:hypothetical protein